MIYDQSCSFHTQHSAGTKFSRSRFWSGLSSNKPISTRKCQYASVIWCISSALPVAPKYSEIVLCLRYAHPRLISCSMRALQENGSTLFGVLSLVPMFVPSLSWQNDHFCIRNGRKEPFSYRSERLKPGLMSRSSITLRRLFLPSGPSTSSVTM